jgi:uncharacterized protein (TIGR03435 family)
LPENLIIRRILLLAAIGIAIVTASGPLSPVNFPRVLAQSSPADWEKAAGGKMSFDVASVRQNTNPSGDPQSNVPLNQMDSFSPTGGLLQASNFPLSQYMAFAYKLSPEEIKMVQPQLPKWAKTSNYDIVARASGNPTKDQLRLMMQALLVDRFKLALHYETKQMPVLALMLDKPGKLGPSLREHKDDGVPCTTASASGGTSEPITAGGFPRQCGTVDYFPSKSSGIVSMGARALPSSILANTRGTWYDGPVEPVVDDTGLGTVDFHLEFTPQRMTIAGLQFDLDGPTLLEALKEQLGLKFESRVASVQSMIIDHVEEPSPN